MGSHSVLRGGLEAREEKGLTVMVWCGGNTGRGLCGIYVSGMGVC